MSEFHVTVFKVDNVVHHPNADRLDIINVFGGYPCCVERDRYKIGDLAVYIPVDTVLPESEVFSFLAPGDRKRLRAKRFRGIFSMGLVIPALQGMNEGDEVTNQLGIERWEPVDDFTCSDNERDPEGLLFAKYTDIESLRKELYSSAFRIGEEVILTEKIHGANWRCVFSSKRDELFVGSRTMNKRRPENLSSSQWWGMIEKYDIEEKLQSNDSFKDLILFGEVYGQVGGFSYGTRGRSQLMLFDVFDLKSMRYLDYDVAKSIAKELGVPWVPELCRVHWDGLQELLPLAEGKSTVVGAENIREGFVIRPLVERFESNVGRLILKIHGQGFLLRK